MNLVGVPPHAWAILIPHKTKFTGQADTVKRVGRGFGRLVECGVPAIDAVVGLWSQRHRPQLSCLERLLSLKGMPQGIRLITRPV